MEEKDYLSFKHLLEYFVSHLEWNTNNDTTFKGYSHYIEPLLSNNSFRKTGQGYNGDKIQNHISNWDHFENSQVCINVMFNQRAGYKSKNCYLNWIWTGINIIAEWNGNHIVGLYQEIFADKTKNSPATWTSLGISNSLNSLELFNNSSTVTNDLKKFYQVFRTAFDKHNLQQKQLQIMAELEKIEDVLRYKKQIILQGPPGTGKTREAKLISKGIIGKELNDSIILDSFRTGQKIKTPSGNKFYTIVEINTNSKKIKLKRESETEDFTSFGDIQDAYSKKLWQSSLDQNNQRRAASLAKYLFDNLLNNSNQFKLIQFHPSYMYEDFVRGIVSKPNDVGDGLLYEAENKILAKFAQKALLNYQASSMNTNIIKSDLEHFKSYILEEIDINGKYDLSENIYIFYADEKRFKYKGDNWTAHPNGLNMNFEQIQKILDLNLNTRQEINKCIELNALTRQHASYFQKFVELFKAFISSNPAPSETTNLKHYVLVIDEINRANLSSVLGELIYALEYRGEAVDSMYAVEDSILSDKNKLILPPNLYIIGTMNTADRSVGHIDYAIRRRFAFVDVLPKKLADNDEIYFNEHGYSAVEAIFTRENVSVEFEIKDIQLGHSYFIAKKNEAKNEEERNAIFKMKMDYEVKPILREYLRDGILQTDKNIGGESIKDYIEKL